MLALPVNGGVFVLTLKIALLLVFFHGTLRAGCALGDRREQSLALSILPGCAVKVCVRKCFSRRRSKGPIRKGRSPFTLLS